MSNWLKFTQFDWLFEANFLCTAGQLSDHYAILPLKSVQAGFDSDGKKALEASFLIAALSIVCPVAVGKGQSESSP